MLEDDVTDAPFEALLGDNHGRSLGLNHTGYLRNCRGIAELKWCRAMLANGGVEPIEWAPELEPSPEGVTAGS